MQQAITFTNCGQMIFGMLHLPEAARRPPFPALVMLHGFTGNRVEPHQLFVKAARRFASEGIVTLRFDFRCCGESEGVFEELTIEGMISDALAALRLVRAREDVHGDRVGLLGLSLGGAIAASVAAREEAALRCLVLWAAVADLRRAFQIKAPEDLIENLGKRVVHDYYGNALSQRLLDELMAFKPAERVRSYKGPALIMHGDADASIPPDDSDAYLKALGEGPRVERHLVKGADHVFSALSWERELIDTTTRFLKKSILSN